MKYRILKPGEIIRKNDQIRNGFTSWCHVPFYLVGNKVDVYDTGYFRRKIIQKREKER